MGEGRLGAACVFVATGHAVLELGQHDGWVLTSGGHDLGSGARSKNGDSEGLSRGHAGKANRFYAAAGVYVAEGGCGWWEVVC
jgi:hypothetical protein